MKEDTSLFRVPVTADFNAFLHPLTKHSPISTAGNFLTFSCKSTFIDKIQSRIRAKIPSLNIYLGENM